jgi:hypothetical protein
MKIIRFLIRNLRNEEWFRFHTEFFDFATLCGLDVLKIKHLYHPYEVLYKEADLLLEILRKSFVTADSVIANSRRTEIFLGLRITAKYLRKVLSPEKQAAAVKVFAVVEKYNKVIRTGSLAAKTAAIDNLLQDLREHKGATDVSQEVTLLKLDDWVDDLYTTNENYKQSLAERIEEVAGRPTAGRMQVVRAAMDKYYLGMINIIDTLLLTVNTTAGEDEDDAPGYPVEVHDNPPMTHDEKLLHFAKALNYHIARYKTLLKGRQTRKNKNREEE